MSGEVLVEVQRLVLGLLVRQETGRSISVTNEERLGRDLGGNLGCGGVLGHSSGGSGLGLRFCGFSSVRSVVRLCFDSSLGLNNHFVLRSLLKVLVLGHLVLRLDDVGVLDLFVDLRSAVGLGALPAAFHAGVGVVVPTDERFAAVGLVVHAVLVKL